jgi:hypothetical protein
MTKPFRGAGVPLTLLALVLIGGGCGEVTNEASGEDAPRAGAVAAVAPEASAVAAPDSGDSKDTAPAPIPTTRHIMNRLARRGGLATKIGQELDAEPPPWEKIQEQTQEFNRLASALGKNKPPRGSQESWAKLSLAYADSATALDRAAQAKDREAALAAHDELAESCNECHREHRRMRGQGKQK